MLCRICNEFGMAFHRAAINYGLEKGNNNSGLSLQRPRAWKLWQTWFITISVWLSVCIRASCHQAKPQQVVTGLKQTMFLFHGGETSDKPAEPLGTSAAQQSLPWKVNGYLCWLKAEHSVLASVSFLYSMICAPPNWLIHSSSQLQLARLPAVVLWKQCALTKLRTHPTDLFIWAHAQLVLPWVVDFGSDSYSEVLCIFFIALVRLVKLAQLAH